MMIINDVILRILVGILLIPLISHVVNLAIIGGWSNYSRLFEKFKSAEFESHATLSKENWNKYGGQVRSKDDGSCVWFTYDDSFKVTLNSKKRYLHSILFLESRPASLLLTPKVQNLGERKHRSRVS